MNRDVMSVRLWPPQIEVREVVVDAPGPRGAERHGA